MPCATCGYGPEWHGDGRCPLCACGLTPAQHEIAGAARLCACGCGAPEHQHLRPRSACGCPPGAGEEFPHICGFALWMGQPCPGRRSAADGSRGQWLLLRQAKYKPLAPAPYDRSTWREILARDTALRHAVYDAERAPHESPIVLPPQVPARPPLGGAEVASYRGRQALGLGGAAAAAGWRADAFYARAADGAELSAVKLARDDLRAVATWRRAAGKQGSKSGWSADVAYGWRLGTMPAKITHTFLEEFVNA